MVCVCGVWCVWCVSSYVPDNLFVYGSKSEGRRVGVAGVEFFKKLSRCLTITQRHGRQAGRLAKSEACNLVNFIIYLSLLLMIAHLYSLWFLFCCCFCFSLLCFCRVFPLSVHICKFPAREIKFMCIF